MTKNRALDTVYQWLLRRNLSEALTAMEGYLSSYSGAQDADRLYAIQADFQLMSDYWKRGLISTTISCIGFMCFTPMLP